MFEVVVAGESLELDRRLVYGVLHEQRLGNYIVASNVRGMNEQNWVCLIIQ
ncbi:hypothetical protein [Lachnoclostridium sp.]|uniref:hypothetical protein n=1 Tax=Lachnoclostridium sp. TaxID=2028282 RepID=UPI00289B1698|nr:hypothetical protein [Lachnoclostridium sp.]